MCQTLSSKTTLKQVKIECKNGEKRVVLLPLKTTFTKVGVDGSLSSKPVKNTKNKPLEPQNQEEGGTLGACVQ